MDKAEMMREAKRKEISEKEKIDGVMSYGQRKEAMDAVEFEIKKMNDPAATSPKVKKKIDFLKENTKID
jgi:Cys-tRNA synthase (O-phospho-L-seryl-tRNA:Cys-tRNA synthase)